jgi:hypothetical protein
MPRALLAELPRIEADLAAMARLQSAHPAQDGSERLLVELADGQAVESVLLPREGLCISSQVGCAVGCVFCMTGREGLVRHVTSGEMVAQVVLARQRRPVRKVVFMGDTCSGDLMAPLAEDADVLIHEATNAWIKEFDQNKNELQKLLSLTKKNREGSVMTGAASRISYVVMISRIFSIFSIYISNFMTDYIQLYKVLIFNYFFEIIIEIIRIFGFKLWMSYICIMTRIQNTPTIQIRCYDNIIVIHDMHDIRIRSIALTYHFSQI